MLALMGGFEWFKHGGWAMYPLLLLSVWSLYVILSRAAYFLTTQRKLQRDLDSVARGMAALPERMEGELAPLLARALRQGQLDTERAEIAVERELQTAAQGVSSLDTIAMIAPMFGLLGTVSGMIDVFFRVSQSQSGIDVGILSRGISEALVATWSGLAVAIPAFIAYRAYRGRLLGLESDYYTLVDDIRQIIASGAHRGSGGQPAAIGAEAQTALESQRPS